jgi:hypothetical protein
MRDRAARVRRDEADAAEARADQPAAPAHPLHALQQQHGNQAVVAALGAQAKLTVGAVHDPAEAEADRIAAQVLRHLSSGGTAEVGRAGAGGPLARQVRRRASEPASEAPGHGLEGGEALPETESAIERRRGGGAPMDPTTLARMESAFGTDLSDVRVHTGGDASGLSRDLNARAFTTGNDVFFGNGEYRPGTTAGDETLAHELAHTLQQGGGGTQRVHRKMRGSRDAALSMGGAKSTKGLRKVIQAKTNWDKIVSGLGAYEALEETLLAGGKNPDMGALAAIKPKMLKILKTIEADIALWQKANGASKAEKQAEAWDKKAGSERELQGTDEREKAERRQFLGMLKPRVANEIASLQSEGSKAWLDSLGLAPKVMTGTGKEDRGQKNVVNELKYKTESGEFSGYFKAEKGFQEKTEYQETDVGIRQTDPNYGARTIAMYKIDKLLGAEVTARAEFATHVDKSGKTVLGTVLESAKGKQPGKTKLVMTSEEAKHIPGAVALDDPVLQQSLNKLQILDAICGQLDRHGGNYYIQMDDSGRVTGVTGIDLDMAFGSKQQTGDKSDPTAENAINFKGLPAQIDQEFGERLLKISPKDIENALRGLLSDDEVAAAVARFNWVCGKIRELQATTGLVKKWGAETALRDEVQDAKGAKGYDQKTYKDDMVAAAWMRIDEDLEAAFAELKEGTGPAPYDGDLLARELDDAPDIVRTCISGGLVIKSTRDVYSAWILDNRQAHHARALVGLVTHAIVTDHGLISRLMVAMQEDVKINTPYDIFKLLQPEILRLLPAMQAKLKA